MAEILGTSDDDILFGTPEDDIIIAFEGNDFIFDFDGGNDILYGAEGTDIIFGGSGDDFLIGGTGTDTLYGDLGNDILLGNDPFTGGADADFFYFNSIFEGIDTILDFSSQEGDVILIGFDFGATSNDQFSYNPETGGLFFLENQLAILDNKPADFSTLLDIVVGVA